MRRGTVDLTVTRETGDESRDVVVSVEYERDAYGIGLSLHRDDAVYGPLTDDERERARDLVREECGE